MRPLSESGTRVFEAVLALHEQEQVATRELVAELTGLKLSVVDDRLGALVDEGLLLRVQRGVFAPVPQHGPARAVSRTLLPGGMSKVEIGDDVLTLTPHECRMLGELLAGSALQASQIAATAQVQQLAASMELELGRLRRQGDAGGAHQDKRRRERVQARLEMAKQRDLLS